MNDALIDDEWGTFFMRNVVLVGISIDEPRAPHDAYRPTNKGESSFDVVMHGWECRQGHEVDVNILCIIHAANADHPLEVYRFFRDDLGRNTSNSSRSSSGRAQRQ